MLVVIILLLAVKLALPTAASPLIDWYKNIFLYVVDWPFNVVLLSVSSTLSIETLFFPSITIPSDALEISFAFLTIISAVE